MRNKKIIVTFFVVSLFMTSDPKAHAGAWGESIAAAIMQTTIESIKRQIEGALLGTLKVAAVQLLNNQVFQLIDGSLGESSVIYNFEQFLTTIPEEKANRVITKDFLSQSLRGTESGANYVDALQGSKVTGNYNSYLKEAVLKSTVNAEKIPKNNFAECNTGNSDPRVAIAEGDFRAINCLVASPANNPIGISIAAEQLYNKTLEDKKKEQEVIAQSSGTKPILDAAGNVITTAGTVQNLIDDVTTLGNKIIVGADNPAEFLGGVVSSVVNRTITQVIQRGTGSIQRTIRQEIGTINSQTNRAISDAEGILGPAGGILNTRVNQTTGGIGTTSPIKKPSLPVSNPQGTPCFSGAASC
ncbi:MAG: hypothetical protein AAB845_03640 [Patescibacteria group bacterium]